MIELTGHQVHAMAALYPKNFCQVRIYEPGEEVPESPVRRRHTISKNGEITFLDLAKPDDYQDTILKRE